MLVDACPPAQSLRVVNRSPLAGRRGRMLPGTAASSPQHHWVLHPFSIGASGLNPRQPNAGSLGATLASIGPCGSGPLVEVLPVHRVASPEQAQVLLYRRKPPLRPVAQGWRASNGRSRLQVIEVRRQQVWRFEPQVEVLVSPHLRAPVLQATALHELGHAFGLWGHSSDPVDVMAVHQGQQPVLQLSDRDRQTLRWVRDQPNGAMAPRFCSIPLDPASRRQLPQARDRSPLFGRGCAADPAECLRGNSLPKQSWSLWLTSRSCGSDSMARTCRQCRGAAAP